jgi:hypothetical protein
MVRDLASPLCAVQRDGGGQWVKEQVPLTATGAESVHWLVLHDEECIRACVSQCLFRQGTI